MGAHCADLRSKQRLIIGLGRIQPDRLPRLVDLLLLVGAGTLILSATGALQRTAPFGDDAVVHITNIVSLARNFPNVFWDPRSFNGYSPVIGFPWTIYGPLALAVSLSLDPIGVFRAAFLIFHVLVGVCLYYFASRIEAPRVVAISLPLLVWSAIGYWEYSIRGGAYIRLFSLPFLLVALALTYDHVGSLNRGEASRRYWLLLFTWVLTILGDVYVAIVGTGIATCFLLLSAGWRNIAMGILRWAKTFLPVLTLTAWYWVPLAEFLQGFGSTKSDLNPILQSQAYWIGPILTIVAAVIARRWSGGKIVRQELKAIIVSLNIVLVYFLVMGWPNPLWEYLPRLMAAYDSLEIPSLIFPILAVCLFALVRQIRPIKITRQIAMVLLSIVVVNAIITIPLIKPLDWTGSGQAIAGNLSLSDNYRVSLLGRILTRGFPFNYPGAIETGGRLYVLDANSYYQSWYQTEVFFKDDLNTLNSVYLEDQPYRDATQLLSTPNNFAETTFWLDWYGVSSIALPTTVYPVSNTVTGYSERAALFSATQSSTSFGPVFFSTYNEPTPILVATNSSIVGFYSQQQNSRDEYNSLLALLSYLGLGPRYVVPLYLQSLNGITPSLVDYLVTDSYTYSTQLQEFNSLQAQGINLLVAPSQLDRSGAFDASQTLVNQPTHLAVPLSQLQAEGTAGSYDLLAMIQSIRLQRADSISTTSSPSQTITLTPGGWTLGYARNANGYLESENNNLTLTINIRDPASSAQLNVFYALPAPIPLLPQGMTRLSVTSNTDTLLGEIFDSSNFTSNYVARDQEIGRGQTTLQIPISNYTKVLNASDRFFFADGFTIAVNIPPGHSTAIIQLANASLTIPAFAAYKFPQSTPLATNGFFTHLLVLPQGSSMILTDPEGHLSGSYDSRGSPYSTIIPLGEFVSEANQSFTVMITTGPAQPNPISLFSIEQSPWVPVQSRWQTSQNLAISKLPGGFRGLLWKETYTAAWSVQTSSGNGDASSQTYYLAGPGVVYVPLDPPSVGMRISYIPFSPVSIAIFVASAGLVIPLIVFRKKIYRLGALTGGHSLA